MNNLTELAAIFGNDPMVVVEERVNIETGHINYGIISKRGLDYSEINQLKKRGYKFNGLGYHQKDLVIILEKENEQLKKQTVMTGVF
jgi:hypothetical protein